METLRWFYLSRKNRKKECEKGVKRDMKAEEIEEMNKEEKRRRKSG